MHYKAHFNVLCELVEFPECLQSVMPAINIRSIRQMDCSGTVWNLAAMEMFFRRSDWNISSQNMKLSILDVF